MSLLSAIGIVKSMTSTTATEMTCIQVEQEMHAHVSEAPYKNGLHEVSGNRKL